MLGLTAIVAFVLGARVPNPIARRPTTTTSSTGMGGMPGMPGMGSAPSPPPGAGPSAVYISPAKQQLIGVRVAPVARRRVGANVRTPGVLAYDETRVTQVHTKVSGWIERVFVDYVGQRVRRGQPLFAIYSPQLVSAQGEYLVALQAKRALGPTPSADTVAGANAVLEASRTQLRRLDVTDAEIAALEQSNTVRRTLAIAAPFDGVVVDRKAFAGQFLTPEMDAFRLADLSKLWVVGQAFEFEADAIRTGESMDVELPYETGTRVLSTTIDFVYPDVDPSTRRVRFRASLDNAHGELKPDTYVDVVLRGAGREELVVPREAVLDDGERTHVLIALPDGYFEPRDVRLGSAREGFFPVVSGLREGERVVVSAQFLVDSETNLMAAMQNMAMSMPGMEMGSTPRAPASSSPPPSAPPSTTTAPPTAPSASAAPPHHHGM